MPPQDRFAASKALAADLALPIPQTVKLADDRTDEWIARFRELHAAGEPG